MGTRTTELKQHKELTSCKGVYLGLFIHDIICLFTADQSILVDTPSLLFFHMHPLLAGASANQGAA